MHPSALAAGFEPACTTSGIPSLGPAMRQAKRDSEPADGDIEERPGTVPTMTTDQIEEAAAFRQPGTASPDRIDLPYATDMPARPAGPLSRGGGSVGGSAVWQAPSDDFSGFQARVETSPGSRGLLSADPGELMLSGASLNSPPTPAQRSAPEAYFAPKPAYEPATAPRLTWTFGEAQGSAMAQTEVRNG